MITITLIGYIILLGNHTPVGDKITLIDPTQEALLDAGKRLGWEILLTKGVATKGRVQIFRNGKLTKLYPVFG